MKFNQLMTEYITPFIFNKLILNYFNTHSTTFINQF